MATEQLNLPTSSTALAAWLNGLTGAGYTTDSGGRRIDGRRVLNIYNPVQEAQYIGSGLFDDSGPAWGDGPAPRYLNGAVGGVFDESFADREGFGDLWRSGYSAPVNNGFDSPENRDATYSPELLDRLSKYQVARLGFGDDMRQFAVIDPATGKVVSATQPRAYNDAFKSQFLPAALALVGGAALGSWMGAGSAAAEGAGMSLADAAALDAAEIGMTGGGLGGASGGGALGAAAGSPLASLNAAQLSGTAGFGETVGAAIANGVPAANAINPALIESAVGTAGYGASSAGAGNALSLAGGGLGMSGSATSIYDAVVSATGSPQLANLAAQGGSGLSQVWNSLSPLQKVQLGSQLGGLAAGAAAGGGTKVSTTGQSGAGNLQMDIARQLQGLGTTELNTARTRQAQFDPQFQQIINAALASQQTNDQRSQQAWDEYTNTFLPAARRMADTAANFDTAGRRAEAGAEARAGVDAQMARVLQGQNRDLGRRGVSLSSGQSLARDMAARFAGAKASASADTAARRDVENTGIALTNNVANFGNQVAGLGLSAAQLGLHAGNTAAGTAATRQNTYNASLTPALTSLGNAANAAGGAGNTFNGVANINLQKNAQDNAGYAGLGSLIGGLGAAFLSDPKTKTVHGKADGKKALRTLADANVYRWTYKKGHGDGGTHIGRMAGEGDKDAPGGLKAIDVISEMGTHHAAIAELAKDVKQIKRRLSLADVEDAKIIRRDA